jgi:plastocyanin
MRKRHLSLVKRASVLVAIPLSVLAIASCGDDNGSSSTSASTAATTPTTSGTTTTETSTNESSGGKPTKLSLSADQSAIKYDKTKLEASAGKVTIDMKNPSALQHNVVISGNGVNEEGEVVGQGGTSTVTANLKPGKYTFFCSVDGHEQAGMKGTLTVK